MIIPVPVIWSRSEPEDPNDRIDRTLGNRAQRLMAGISLSRDLRRIEGALTVTLGQGKYLRLRHVARANKPLAESLTHECQTLISSERPTLERYAAVCKDLADVQNAVIQQLKVQAGKYVDRVVAVAVHGPGIWVTDFDNQLTYRGFCDPTYLAELTGISVIDDFPSRDIAVGGNGTPLDGLPMWLALADRNRKIAQEDRYLLTCCDLVGIYRLPASDGLDAEIPNIQFAPSKALEFLQRLPAQLRIWKQEENLAKLYAGGVVHTEFTKALAGLLTRSADGGPDRDEEKTVVQTLDGDIQQLCDEFLFRRKTRLADLIRTLLVVVVDDVLASLGEQPFSKLVVAAEEPVAGCLINCLRQKSDHRFELERVDQLGIAHYSLAAVSTALLGLMHIDQMPANIPWLTNADSQRILGTLTPGRPANWRQLIRMMADFQPPAMKLKDAI